MRGFAILLILLLSSCAGVDWNQGPPPGSILIGEREQVKINAMTNETAGGTPIEKFYCISGVMVCRQYAGTKFCSCQSGEIVLPGIMGL